MNDQMAVGVLKVLSAQEIAVPQEVAVTGFDDIIVSRYLSPGLTTVRQPAEELGATAVSSLFEAVRGTHLALREMVLPTELVVRSSCGCAPQPWFDAPHAGVETAGPADTLTGGAHSVAEAAGLAELAG